MQDNGGFLFDIFNINGTTTFLDLFFFNEVKVFDEVYPMSS